MMDGLTKWLFGFSGSDLAGAESRSLRFSGMPENAAVLLAIIVLFALLSWLTIRNYRREGAAPNRVKSLIAGLRIATLFLLLLVFLQPAIVATFARIQTSAVVVLVDDTLSMQWKDRYTDAKQSSALAAALGVPESKLAGDDRIMRTEAVRAALLKEKGVVSKLAADHPILLCRYGKTEGDSYVDPICEIPASNAKDAGLPQNFREGMAKLSAEGRNTDIGRAVREALNRFEGRKLGAMVLLSDGRSTAAGDARLAGAAQLARQRGVPIYAVAVGDPTPPGNVAVTQLLGPREVRAGAKISFTALVTHRSLPNKKVTIKLLRSRPGENKWEETEASAELTLPAAGGAGASRKEPGLLQEVPLETQAPDVGAYLFKAQIMPIREDSIASDNEASAMVRVTDQKLKVLLIAGSASWEFQFLRNYLLRGKDHFAASVWQQNADERFNQEASTGMKLTTLPTTMDDLVQYDVVILCDPRHTPGSMDERFVGLLDSFVGKHQGGLCYLAGNKFAGRTLQSRGEFAPLVAILPVVLSDDQSTRVASGEDLLPFVLELTPEGRSHPFLRLAEDQQQNNDMWRRMPNVYRRQRVKEIKPLATALGVRGGSSLVPGERPEPLLVVQHYGRGRVAYMGFDGIWRIRALDDGALFEKFWANALEFLGSGRIEKKRILITTKTDAYDAGTDVDVRIEAYNKEMNPMDAKGLTLEVRSLDSDSATTHTIRRERSGLFTGTIRPDRVGSYELNVKTDAAGVSDWTPDDVATRRIQVRLPQAEFWKPEADMDAMKTLAGTADGFLQLHEIDSLAERIPPGKTRTTVEIPHSVWNTKLLLIVLGLLLLGELTLRKWHNMM